MSYAKVFDSMLTSSVWQESHATVRVWLTILLLKDQDGLVDAALPGLAHAARVTLEECQDAVTILSSPDRFSRTRERDGRRIAENEAGGWIVINHGKYREKLNTAERREYKRRHEQTRRERTRAGAARRLLGQSVDNDGQT